MIINADKSKVDSTSINDVRITKIGRIIRKLKLDEISQLYNVFIGEMSLVGPRPNVQDEVKKYTNLERILLNYKPGITDFSSIIFSDEGDILKNSKDPDLDYNLYIRPRKNLIALLYFKDNNLLSDIYIVLLTIINIFDRKFALKMIYKFMSNKYKNFDLKFILRDKQLSKIENINNFFEIYEDKFF